MESVGKERGKEMQKRPAEDAKRQQNAKKMLNRRNELKDLLETQDLAVLCAKNELQIQDSGFGIQVLGFRSQGSGIGSRGSGVRIQDSGYRSRDSGARSQGNNRRFIGTGGRVDKQSIIRGPSQEEFFKI
jgi:hypothetical protein